MATNGSEQDDLKQRKSGTLAEMRGPNPEVERVTDLSAVELEAFMHEDVEIFVHRTPLKGAVEILTPNVNGINQPVIRGTNQVVKRKYIEALARAHTLTYEQRVQNSSMPENISMVENKTPDYPFDVIRDTKRGKEWLAKLRNSI